MSKALDYKIDNYPGRRGPFGIYYSHAHRAASLRMSLPDYYTRRVATAAAHCVERAVALLQVAPYPSQSYVDAHDRLTQAAQEYENARCAQLAHAKGLPEADWIDCDDCASARRDDDWRKSDSCYQCHGLSITAWDCEVSQ